jgi:conjugal transfer pilus assembly protein TraK
VAPAAKAGEMKEESEPDTASHQTGAEEKEEEVSRRVTAALAKIKAGPVRHGGQGVSTSLEVVQVAPGRNETITVAGDHLNRIVTPFENPVAHTVDKAKVKVDGNSLYVSLGKDDGPAALFITEDGEQDPSISLTLVPKEVAPREVRLKLNGNWPVSVGGGGVSVVSGGKAARWEKSLPYEAAIEEVLQRTALGEVPPGYNLRDYFNYDPQVSCRLPAQIEPRQVLEGHNFLLVVSRMTNRSSSSLTVTEEACYRPGVRAVAVWPRVRLEPRQTAELYLVYERTSPRPPRLRPSVLGLLPGEVRQ